MAKKWIIIIVVIALIGVSVLAVRDLRSYPQNLGEYLQDLLTTYNMTPSADDFFEPVEDPYLAFAKMLNLIPTSAQSNDSINMRKVRLISEQFVFAVEICTAIQRAASYQSRRPLYCRRL